MTRSDKHPMISLYAQIVVILIVLLAIVQAMSFMISNTASQRILREQRERDAINAFEQAESNIHSLLDSIDKLSLGFLVDQSVINFARPSATDRLAVVEAQIELYKRIDSTLIAYTALDSILVFLDDGRVGGSSIPRTYFQHQEPTKASHPFFATDIYANAIKHTTGITWHGGMTRSLFSDPSAKEEKRIREEGPSSHDMLVLGVRSVKLPQVPARILLVTSLKEGALRSLYEKLNDESTTRVSILDSAGNLISGGDGGRYGKQVGYFSQIDREKTYGSLLYKEEGRIWQVVYYRMQRTGWLFVNEAPLDVYEKGLNQLRLIMVFTTAGGMTLVAVLYALWVKRMLQPLEVLTGTMKRVGEGDLTSRMAARANSREIYLLNLQFNKMLDDINSLMKRMALMEQDKRRLEIEALQAQINPHFIYNTLTTIRWMATMASAHPVANALIAFAKVLRPVFAGTDMTWPLTKEIAFTRHYIDIMNYRFGGSVAFGFDVHDCVTECEVPRFILQPLIENAITHGLAGGGQGRIDIRVSGCDDSLMLQVEDNGAGIPQEKLAGLLQGMGCDAADSSGEMKKIGLRNVFRRVYLHFDGESRFSIESEPGLGTRITIFIPKTDV